MLNPNMAANTIGRYRRTLALALLPLAFLSFALPRDLAAQRRPRQAERSQNVSDREMTITLTNSLQQAVRIVWVDFDGREQSSGQLPPGTTGPLTTYPGHFFRFKVNNKVVGTYRVTQDARQTYNVGKQTPGGQPERSENLSNRELSITLTNSLRQAVQIRWVDFEGKEQDNGQMPPGGNVSITTYPGHLFRFKANNQVVGTYRVTRNARQAYNVGQSEKSLDGGINVNVTFNNQTGQPIDLVWVDFDGNGKNYGKLAPGESRQQQTGFKHLWRFTVGGKVVATYRVTNAARQSFDVRAGSPSPAKPEMRASSNQPIRDFRRHAPFLRPLNLSNPDLDSIRQAIAYVTNEKRLQQGRKPLAISKRLDYAAQMHANDMVAGNFFSHDNPRDPTKRKEADRARLAGITNPHIAENINQDTGIKYVPNSLIDFKGPGVFIDPSSGAEIPPHTPLSLAESLVASWMKSTGHRQNILSTDALEIGCGVAFFPDTGFNSMPSVKAVQKFQLYEATKAN